MEEWNLLDLGMFPLHLLNWSACLRCSGKGPLSALLATLGPETQRRRGGRWGQARSRVCGAAEFTVLGAPTGARRDRPAGSKPGEGGIRGWRRALRAGSSLQPPPVGPQGEGPHQPAGRRAVLDSVQHLLQLLPGPARALAAPRQALCRQLVDRAG